MNSTTLLNLTLSNLSYIVTIVTHSCLHCLVNTITTVMRSFCHSYLSLAWCRFRILPMYFDADAYRNCILAFPFIIRQLGNCCIFHNGLWVNYTYEYYFRVYSLHRSKIYSQPIQWLKRHWINSSTCTKIPKFVMFT